MQDNKWYSGLAFGLVGGLAVSAAIFAGLSDGLPGWWKHDGAIVTSSDTMASWLVAIFSFVAAVFLWLTLLATQEMARDTRRIGEAQVKAYLDIKLTQIEPHFPDHGVWIFRVSIRNSGQSPARQVFVSVKAGEAGSLGKTVLPDLGAGEHFEGGIYVYGVSKDSGFRPKEGPWKPFVALISVRFLDVFYGPAPERFERRNFSIERVEEAGEIFRIRFSADHTAIFERMNQDPTFAVDDL